MEDRLRFFRERGMALDAVLDVGAHHGEFAALVRRVQPTADVLSFEADADNAPHLAAAGAQFEICCLGDRAREAVFYKTLTAPSTTGNSLYRENTPHFDAYATQTVQVRPLDDVLRAFPRFQGRVDLLKLDVQGAELDVLRGATETLKRTSLVLAECSVIEYNAGGALLHEVVAYLATQGFRVLDIADVAYMDGFLLQTDLLFVKAGHPMVPRLDAAGRPSAGRGG